MAGYVEGVAGGVGGARMSNSVDQAAVYISVEVGAVPAESQVVPFSN